MTNFDMNCLTVEMDIIAGGLLGQRLMRGEVVTGGVKIGIFSLGLGAVVLHAALLYTNLWTASGLNLALTPAFSLIAWVVAVLYLASSLIRPGDNLGAFFIPIT